jgi:transposase
MLCERLDYDLLFRWLLDLELDEPSFDHSTFSRNRARLLQHAAAGEFLRAVVEQARGLELLSAEHFTVDGTLIEAWASQAQRRRAGPAARRPRQSDGELPRRTPQQ